MTLKSFSNYSKMFVLFKILFNLMNNMLGGEGSVKNSWDIMHFDEKTFLNIKQQLNIKTLLDLKHSSRMGINFHADWLMIWIIQFHLDDLPLLWYVSSSWLIALIIMVMIAHEEKWEERFRMMIKYFWLINDNIRGTIT